MDDDQWWCSVVDVELVGFLFLVSASAFFGGAGGMFVRVVGC
ncbi:hypothetical protein ACOBQX_30750 [Actinokineospora sp. G85]